MVMYGLLNSCQSDDRMEGKEVEKLWDVGIPTETREGWRRSKRRGERSATVKLCEQSNSKVSANTGIGRCKSFPIGIIAEVYLPVHLLFGKMNTARWNFMSALRIFPANMLPTALIHRVYPTCIQSPSWQTMTVRVVADSQLRESAGGDKTVVVPPTTLNTICSSQQEDNCFLFEKIVVCKQRFETEPYTI